MSYRVLPFSGKEEDWNMWSKKFLATAKRRGYKEILIGKADLPDPDEPLDDLNPTEKKILAANELAYNDLLLACSDDISFGIVDSCVYNEDGDGDARKAWSQLSERYEPKTGATKVQLKAMFNKCRLANVEKDPEEWIVELERIRQRLAVMKSHIGDEDMLVHILNNMPKEYESIVESSEEKLELGKLTLSALRVVLQTKYQRMKRYDEKEKMRKLDCSQNSLKRIAVCVARWDIRAMTVGRLRKTKRNAPKTITLEKDPENRTIKTKTRITKIKTGRKRPRATSVERLGTSSQIVRQRMRKPQWRSLMIPKKWYLSQRGIKPQKKKMCGLVTPVLHAT